MSGRAPFDAAAESWHRSVWGWVASRWCCVHGLVWKQSWGFSGQRNGFAILVPRICSDACFKGSSSCLQRNQQFCNCDHIQHLWCMWYCCSLLFKVEHWQTPRLQVQRQQLKAIDAEMDGDLVKVPIIALVCLACMAQVVNCCCWENKLTMNALKLKYWQSFKFAQQG